ncbi:MAG TPA: virulence factor MviN, partial [Micrococcaceae bacterium]
YTLGNILAVVVTHFFLRARLGNYGAAGIFTAHLRFIAAAALSGAVGAIVLWLFGGFSAEGFSWASRYAAALVLAVVGLAMAAVYFAALKLFRVSELEDLLAPFKAKLRGRIPGIR